MSYFDLFFLQISYDVLNRYFFFVCFNELLIYLIHENKYMTITIFKHPSMYHPDPCVPHWSTHGAWENSWGLETQLETYPEQELGLKGGRRNPSGWRSYHLFTLGGETVLMEEWGDHPGDPLWVGTDTPCGYDRTGDRDVRGWPSNPYQGGKCPPSLSVLSSSPSMPGDPPQGLPISPNLWNSAPGCDPRGKYTERIKKLIFNGALLSGWLRLGGGGRSWHWNTDFRSTGSLQGSLEGDPWRGGPGIPRPICAGGTGGWWPVPGTLGGWGSGNAPASEGAERLTHSQTASRSWPPPCTLSVRDQLGEQLALEPPWGGVNGCP